MSRLNPLINKLRLIPHLPGCIVQVLRNRECTKSMIGVARDCLELFFDYRTFPDHYGPCRLWELDRSEWKYYFGSNYQFHQSEKLKRTVQPAIYEILFNDKEVCKRLCRETGVNMPHTYGVIRPDQDYRQALRSWIDEAAGDGLIVKPLCGSAGRGIVLTRLMQGEIRIQSRERCVPLDQYCLDTDAVVQRILKQDARMDVFCSTCVNTVRVVTLYTKQDRVLILAATLRTGVGDAYVDNWSAGGVAVGVDRRMGTLERFGYDKTGNRHLVHPTSGVRFEGFVVPEWPRILDVATTVQKAFPFYRLLGMDIALGQSGDPVLIEVNDQPDLLFQEQTSGPLFKDEEILREFAEYDLLVNRHHTQLYRSLQKKDCPVPVVSECQKRPT